MAREKVVSGKKPVKGSTENRDGPLSELTSVEEETGQPENLDAPFPLLPGWQKWEHRKAGKMTNPAIATRSVNVAILFFMETTPLILFPSETLYKNRFTGVKARLKYIRF
jgi:hypothetical protein